MQLNIAGFDWIANMNEKTLPPFATEPAQSVGAREKWIARFDNFLLAMKIPDAARQKAQLLHVAGKRCLTFTCLLRDTET